VTVQGGAAGPTGPRPSEKRRAPVARGRMTQTPVVSMKSIKGTQTERNLLTAFAGESQARNRYSYAASQARKEDYLEVAAIFEETARNEMEHAKRFFKFLEGGEVKVEAAFPAGTIGTTAENLKAAADGEHYENVTMYPDFADVAEKEGFKDVAMAFRMVARAEKHHEDRYLFLLRNVKEGTVWKRPSKVRWKCDNCGYIHEGPTPPEKCPACQHERKYFQVLTVEYY